MAERGREAPDWVAPARAERRRHCREAMEFRRRREAAEEMELYLGTANGLDRWGLY